MARVVADEAVKILFDLPNRNIPYVLGGASLSGMDCVGLIRWWLQQNGVDCPWRNTHDLCRKMLMDFKPINTKIPVGSVIAIVEPGRPLPDRYTDNFPYVSHVYIKMKEGLLIHASESNGRVLTRDFADKAVPNGGPNYWGLVRGMSYRPWDEGTPDISVEPPPSTGDHVESDPEFEDKPSLVPGSVQVNTKESAGARMRKQPKIVDGANHNRICEVPKGTILPIITRQNGWTMVPYGIHRGWIRDDLLIFG